MTISATQRSPKPAPQRDWTLLYVLDGDNDLREAATLDLIELDKVGTPENVSAAAQLYRGDLKWSLRNAGRKFKQLTKGKVEPAVQNDWRGMKTFQVRSRDSQDETRTIREDKLVAHCDPADPTALKEFVSWGMKKYPAKNYAVILSGHGGADGLLSNSKGDKMSFDNISKALTEASVDSGEKIDVLLLDTCSTAQQSTADSLQGAADFVVAAPNKIKGGGWSESATLNFLEQNSAATPEQLAESFLTDEHSSVTDPVLYDLR